MTDAGAVARIERLLVQHRQLLEQVALSAPLTEVLEGLVRLIEQHSSDGLIASVLLADSDGKHLRHGAAPSLPDSYNAAIDGIEIGPVVGSCGTAAFRREPVIVADIDTDPLWAEFRDLAASAGVRACWSTPLMSEGELLGTFAMYYPDPRVPSDDDRETAALFARTATFAIERHRADLVRSAALAAEAHYAHRLSRLAAVSLELAGAETVDDLLSIVIDRGLGVLNADGGIVAVLDEESGLLRLTRSSSLGLDAVGLTELPLDGPLPASYAARTGERVLLPNRAAGLAFAPEMAEIYESTGPRAWVVVPLTAGGKPLGSLVASWAEEREFSQDELELIDGFAAQCAQSLDRIQTRLSQRHAALTAQRMSEALQRSLLTRPPQPERLSIAVRYLPAIEQAQIGGDWYDAFLTSNGATMLVVGDINGHDRDAAAAMGQVRNVLRGLAYDSDNTPAQILDRLDGALHGLELETLATAVLMQVPPPGRTGAACLRWSNAGHPPPLLLHPDGTTTVLDTEPDLLLGLAVHTRRQDSEVELPEGSTLLLYTDGLVERRGESLDQGLQRLCLALAETPALPLEDLCDVIVERMLPDGGDDDVALLAVRLRGGGEPAAALPAGAGVAQHLEIRADPVAVRKARRFVSDACRAAGVPGDVRDNAVLLTSELVTNAVIHAVSVARLSVSAGPERVRVEVNDGSAALPRRVAADEDATGGRGLTLVEMLATHWGVHELDSGKTVWFELDVVQGA